MTTFTITLNFDEIAVPTGYVFFTAGQSTDDVSVSIQVNRNAPDEVLAHEILHAVKLAKMFTGNNPINMVTLETLEQ